MDKVNKRPALKRGGLRAYGQNYLRKKISEIFQSKRKKKKEICLQNFLNVRKVFQQWELAQSETLKKKMKNNKANERIRKTIDAMATGQSFLLPFSAGKSQADVFAIAKGIGAEIVTRKEASGLRVWVSAPAVQMGRVISYTISSDHTMPAGGRGRPRKEEKENNEETEISNMVNIGSFTEVAEEMHAAAAAEVRIVME